VEFDCLGHTRQILTRAQAYLTKAPVQKPHGRYKTKPRQLQVAGEM